MTADDWMFEPHDFIRYLRSARGGARDAFCLPSRVVMVFGTDSYEALSKAFHARPLDWSPQFSVGRAGRRLVGLVRTSIGAPAAVTDLEESIALGARTVLAFGACGSLRIDLPIGCAVLPTAALSDEGTSRHYGGRGWVRPDPSLLARLRAACARRSLPIREGAVWTTDAVYREGRAKAKSLARRGVVGVEMEASALFTVGRYRGVRVAALLVVSDELAGGVWRPGFRGPAYDRGLQRARRAVVDVMSGVIS